MSARQLAASTTLEIRPRWRRGTIERFVAAHQLVWEGVLGLLTVVYVVLAFGDEELAARVPDSALLALAAVFLAEFAVRLWDASDRISYVRHHWVDAVTAIPLLGPLRALRLLRLVRLGAMVRVLGVADHANSRGRTSLWYLGPLLALVWVGSSYAFWVLEHGINPAMKTFGDAMYLAFATTTTFGYGNAHPVTAAGQVLAGLLIFLGIGLVGFASSQLTARLLHQPDQADLVRRDFESLVVEIHDLRTLLEAGLTPFPAASAIDTVTPQAPEVA
jgi:voltage-gated potassium channel